MKDVWEDKITVKENDALLVGDGVVLEEEEGLSVGAFEVLIMWLSSVVVGVGEAVVSVVVSLVVVESSVEGTVSFDPKCP